MDVLFDPQGRVRNGWKVFGFLLVFAALVMILNVVAKHLLHLHHVGDLWKLSMAIGLVALSSWICLRAEKRPFVSIGFQLNGRWFRELGYGTVGGAGIMAVTALIAMGSGGFHWARGAGDWRTLASGFALFTLVALNEETLFRGYLFQRLLDGLGRQGGLWVGAALFAFAHWGNPGMHGATLFWASVNIALAGFLLGLCYLKTRSLALPIGVHLGWNFTQGNLLGFGVSGTTMAPGMLQPVFQGRPEWLTGGAFGLEASLPCALVCGGAILALIFWKGRPSADSSTVLAWETEG